MSLFALVFDYLSPGHSTHTPPTASPILLSAPPLASPTFSERLHAACLSPTASIQPDPDTMRRELDHTKHDLARAQVDSLRLEERVKMLERTLKETRDILKTREAEVEKMRKELRDRRRSDSQIGNGSRHPLGSPDTRLDRLRRYSPSPSLLSVKDRDPLIDIDEERARIRVQETYMSRLDFWSGAQILQAVHDLNSEILQFAASAIESCTFLLPATQTQTSNPRQMAQSLADTTSRLGPTMSHLLHQRNHSSDPLLIQLALQSSLNLCAARALSSFIIGLPSKADLLLSQIYSEMQKGEEQPVFKKWRALTERYVSALYPTLGEYSTGEVADTMIKWCADVFIVSGCSFLATSRATNNTASPQPSPSSSPPTAYSPPKSLHIHHHQNNTPNLNTHHVSPQTHLRTHHHDQLKRIAQRILRIASIAREEILSTSFELVMADPSLTLQADFGSEMVDAFGEYTSESKGRVLGTVELGLRCVTKVNERDMGVGGVGTSTAGGMQIQHGGGGGNVNGVARDTKESVEAKFESRLLLRPKVVLESVLEVLDR